MVGAVGLSALGDFLAVVPLALMLQQRTGYGIAQPAEFALVPAAAGEGRLAAANGRVETARYVGFTLGPLAGGALAAAGGMRLGMLVNAASFVVVALAVAALHARRVPVLPVAEGAVE